MTFISFVGFLNYTKPFLLAIIVVERVAINTIEMELIGISIAAITGDNTPCTANDNPIIL